MRKYLVSIIILFLCLILYLNQIRPSSEDFPELLFVDVGQGDMAVVFGSGNDMLIVDGGPSYSIPMVYKYMSCCDCEMSITMLLSHPHADHLIGLNRLLLSCLRPTLYFNDVEYDSITYKEFKNRAKYLKDYPLKRGDMFSIGIFDVYVLWPTDEYLNDMSKLDVNNSSAVLLLDNGSFEALLTGDIDASIQDLLNIDEYAYLIDENIDVLKVPHHGSDESYNPGFLAYLKPKLAVISVGKNSYGHPGKRFLEFFKKENIPLLRTDIHGTIRIKVVTNTVTM